MPLTPADVQAARDTAHAFLSAVQKGDEPAARAIVIVGEGETMDFAAMHKSTKSFALAAPAAEGELVVVTATITSPPGESAPPSLPLVLTRAAGPWKVDMGASITRMLGFNLNDVVKGLAEGLGQAMQAGMGAMAQGLEAAFGGEEKPAKKKSRPATKPKSTKPKKKPK